MHIQSCTFNFLSKLGSSIEFDGFLRYRRLGLTWEYKIILHRDAWSYSKSVRYFYLMCWFLFVGLKIVFQTWKFIKCSLKSFLSALKLDNHFFSIFFYPWCNLNLEIPFFFSLLRCILQKMKIFDLS
jgi:hypothetical protein